MRPVNNFMPFFANFRIHEGHQFRLDTRIYLRASDEPSKNDRCIAAIVAKNPGSANPTELNRLTRLLLDGDKLLPYVRNRFRAAYKRSGIEMPQGGYVRVWNVIYLCDATLKNAIKSFRTVSEPLICSTEENAPRIVWFAWGPPNPELQQFTSRFDTRAFDKAFYYDMDTETIVPNVPTITSRVKHTQGLPSEAVETHLASIIGSP